MSPLAQSLVRSPSLLPNQWETFVFASYSGPTRFVHDSKVEWMEFWRARCEDMGCELMSFGPNGEMPHRVDLTTE